MTFSLFTPTSRSTRTAALLAWAWLALAMAIAGSAAIALELEPVRSAWPTAPDSRGRWSTVGEVIVRNAGSEAVGLRRLVAEFLAADKTRLTRDVLPVGGFKQRLFVYSGGSAAGPKAGKQRLQPGQAAVALFSSLSAGAPPARVVVRAYFSDGATVVREVPVTNDSTGPRLRFPLAFGAEPRLRWVAFNTFDTLYHRASFAPGVDGTLFGSQRYAMDILMADTRRKSPAPRAAKAKEQHYAWDRPVVSASAGTVVAAADGYPDVELGENDTDHPLGNFVVIRHPEGVYLMYGHLRKGSVLPRVGHAVAVGQALGRVGSSGMSELPHLHFQVSDDWTGQDDVSRLLYAQGLPALLEGVAVRRGRSLLTLDGAQLMNRDIIEGPATFP